MYYVFFRFLLAVASVGFFSYGSAMEERFFTYTRSQFFHQTDDGYQATSVFPGIRIKQRVYSRIYVCANGLITFGTEYCTYVPNMRSGHDVLAPYWSDLDYRGFNSSVAYSQHRKSDSNALSSKILQETRDYISQNGNVNNFDPTMVFLVTWLNAAPFPSSSYINTDQRATFQLNLATDGKNTYAVYIYQDGKMLWRNYTRPPHVGYSIGGSILDMVLNHTGEFQYYRFDSVIGNTGRKGQWMWNLNADTDVKPKPKRDEACLQWYENQPDDSYVKMIRNHSQTVCPCSFSQVKLDDRYRYWYGYQDVHCYRQRGIWYFHNTKISFFTMCCYHPGQGYLYNEFNPDLGPMTQTYITQSYHSTRLWYRYYRHLARSKATSEDQAAFQNCCPTISDSEGVTGKSYCHLYAQKRPVPDCSNKEYDPPIIGWSGGDPHIKTLDGLTYTFNGIGDYNLLSLKNRSDFIVHCRMSKATVVKNVTTAASKATVFSAFALSAFQGALVEIYLNVSTGNLTLLVNKQIYNVNYFNNTQTINGTDITWKSGNRTQLSVIYESGAGAVVNVFETLLTIQISSLPTFFGKTMGLFGVYNKDTSDDLTRPDGTTLAINSTQETIYYKFGRLWHLSKNQSLFTLDSADYDPAYKPLFFDNIDDLFGNNTALKEKAISLCGRTSFTCLFDVMLTGDTKAAAESKSTLEESDKDQKILVTYPPKILSPKSIFLSYQATYHSQIIATSQSASNLTYSLETSGVVAAIDSKSGKFSLFVNSSVVRLKFLVKDENNLADAFLPSIRLCYCLNGSSCNATAVNTLASSPNFFLTYGKCHCRRGLTGAFCQEIDTDLCRVNPCFTGVNCTNNNINSTADCGPCPNGYAGDGRNCEDIDECANRSHNCHRNALCQNAPGSFNCGCDVGFTGNGTTCTDINECASNTHNCHKMATCVNQQGTFECRCKSNHSGNGTFCKDQDQCKISTHNCHPNATCIDRDVNFDCICNKGFSGNGIVCQDIDECELKSHDCHNKATCTNLKGSFACNCNEGFSGNGTMCKENKPTVAEKKNFMYRYLLIAFGALLFIVFVAGLVAKKTYSSVRTRKIKVSPYKFNDGFEAEEKNIEKLDQIEMAATDPSG